MNWTNKVLKKIQKLNNFPYFTKNPAELEYFTGYTGSNGYLLILNEKEFYFLTDGRYFEAYSRFFPGNIKLLTGEKKIGNWIKELLKEKSNILTINENHFTYAEILAFRKELKPIIIKKTRNRIDQDRIIKTTEEIEKVKEAVSITEEGLSYIIAFIKEGMTEKQVAAELEYYLKLKGADDISFPVIVLFGRNSAYPHGVPGSSKLKKGDVILIDVGIKKDHFCSDMTRTFVFDYAPKGFKENYEFLLSLQKEILSSIKPDMKACLLDQQLKKNLKEKKLEQYYPHSLGHGVGVEVHEFPYLSYLKPKEKLVKGSLFTIEPGIYIPGEYGIRIEDMVYISQKGQIQILTDFPKELLIKK